MREGHGGFFRQFPVDDNRRGHRAVIGIQPECEEQPRHRRGGSLVRQPFNQLLIQRGVIHGNPSLTERRGGEGFHRVMIAAEGLRIIRSAADNGCIERSTSLIGQRIVVSKVTADHRRQDACAFGGHRLHIIFVEAEHTDLLRDSPFVPRKAAAVAGIPLHKKPDDRLEHAVQRHPAVSFRQDPE